LALSKKNEQYQSELKSLADNLPFKRVELPEFRRATWRPNVVRQKRTYMPSDRNAQAISRFLVERGMVELLTPENTLNLFKEMHWRACQIRDLSRNRYANARQWHKAVENARGMISQIEAAEEELFIANRRLIVSCIKPYFWIGQVWLADFLQEGSKALSNAIRKFDFTRGTPFYVYAQKAVQNRLRNFFRDHVRSGSIGMRPSRDMVTIKEIISAWLKEHGKEPDNDVLVKLTGLPEERIVKIRPFIRQWDKIPEPLVSLDAMFGENGTNLYKSQSITLTGNGISKVVQSGVDQVKISVDYPKAVDLGFDSSFFNFKSSTVTLDSSSTPKMNANSVVEFYVGKVIVTIGQV
jgi:DNA-directed RNA polymerase specialized sigma subunit